MSGIISVVKDTFLGGAEKKAAKAEQKGIEKGITATQEATRRAEGQALPLFDAAQQNLGLGFQSALDVFGQSLPAQTDVFQQGNVAAQQALLSGLPQFQNAILGGQVDFSQLQPSQIQTPDLRFFQQQLPQFVNPFEQTPDQTAALMGTNFTPATSQTGGFFPSTGSGRLNQFPNRRR